MNDEVVPKVKEIFNDFREDKKKNNCFDENEFKQKIFNKIFDVIEAQIKKLEDFIQESIVKVYCQTLEHELK